MDAIVTALEEEVAPLVQDKWAASVLRSATQLLNHLSLRVDDDARVLIEDNKDVRYVLETVYRSLSVNADTASLRAAVEEALQTTECPHHDVVALDARNGEFFWKVGLGGTVASGPMTFSLDGHQYVGVCAANSLYIFGLPE